MKRTREANDTLLSPVDGCLYRLFIEQDEDAGNPRQEFDNAGILISWSGDYHSPDKKDCMPTLRGWSDCSESYDVLRPVRLTEADRDGRNGTWPELVAELQDNGQYIILPLHHGRDGLTETNGFTNGYACMSRETILKEWGKPGGRVTQKALDAALRYLRGEIQEYNSWANGEVYALYIDRLIDGEEGDCDGDGEIIDSCGGFYGYEYAREEGLLMLRAAATGKDAEEHARTLAGLKELANI